MGELARVLPLVALAGLLASLLAGCAAGIGEPAPTPADTGPPAGTGEAPPDEATFGDGAAVTPTDLADLDPETRRRFELWQRVMVQLEPCLRPRLDTIDNVEEAGVVAVQVEFDEAGAPIGADLQRGAPARMADNETYRAVVNAILTGVQACAPVTDLPREEFDTWRLFPVVIRPRPA